ncbi:hypothetical protein DPEC_G00010100 [Dallia pectoralis]|uniref:Uncharacterized protein n=1 Tax=Dallia pectoralis TaxID=75939 RepID=A0ACC2HM43_DALPE|nr:hypothetical protein DPEC_G00010100 [Dallia pectoralis]
MNIEGLSERHIAETSEWRREYRKVNRILKDKRNAVLSTSLLAGDAIDSAENITETGSHSVNDVTGRGLNHLAISTSLALTGDCPDRDIWKVIAFLQETTQSDDRTPLQD